MKSSPVAALTRTDQRFGLRAGAVFRRRDVAGGLPAVDRALAEALKSGAVRKARQGLYYVPKKTPFGEAPPSQERLVSKFLDDQKFLLFNPACYNALGLGLTQLYNTTVVYNHKRHGKFTLAGLAFDFRDKPRFPTRNKVTREYLLVDLLNNLDELAEDPAAVLDKVKNQLASFDQPRLLKTLKEFGSLKARRRLALMQVADHA
jgi:hypothetical protein